MQGRLRSGEHQASVGSWRAAEPELERACMSAAMRPATSSEPGESAYTPAPAMRQALQHLRDGPHLRVGQCGVRPSHR